MVGHGARGKDRMILSELTRKWLDTPYEKTSCLKFVHSFLEEATGRSLPDSFEELSIRNFYGYWRADPRAAEIKLCEAVRHYTQPSNPKIPKLLDVLVVRVKDDGLTPAVYVGNGNAIACFIKTGVTVFNLDENNKAIIAGAV